MASTKSRSVEARWPTVHASTEQLVGFTADLNGVLAAIARQPPDAPRITALADQIETGRRALSAKASLVVATEEGRA